MRFSFILRSLTLVITASSIVFSGAAVSQGVRNDQVGQPLISDNGGPWGSWSRAVYCPAGSWAAGYAMRVEPNQRGGDDSALNAVELLCRNRQGQDVGGGSISPHAGFWGDWLREANCPQGAFLTHFQLKVEPDQRRGDDSAANSVAFGCTFVNNISRNNFRFDQRIEGVGGPWGFWGQWRGGFQGAAICGIRAKVEPMQEGGDDSALNDLEFTWCRI